MKTTLFVLTLAALVALLGLSFAPESLVGVRSGLGSLAGVGSALALLAIMLVGGWIWLKDGRKRDD